MNFDDDFDENINKLIKWLTVISICAIILWAVVGIFRFIFPAKPSENKETTIVREQPASDKSVSNKKIQSIMEEDVSSSVKDSSLILDENEARAKQGGGRKFTLNIREIPTSLYFPTVDIDVSKIKKRDIINKKVGDNYIDSVLSYGTLVRWNPEKFPLKVYINVEENLPSTYLNEIKNAFQMWHDSTDGFISFVYVDKEDDADIICRCLRYFPKQCDKEVSVLSKQYFSYDNAEHIKNAKIELASTDCNDEGFAEDMIYALALREIGHSLGLRGHSGNFQEKVLYYPIPSKDHSVRPVINKNDVNTLRLIYSVVPDKTNADFSDEQLKKLIVPKDVWGDSVEISPRSESAILYNIEQSPELPTLHVALANYYKERGDYEKALSIYNKSIVLMNDAEFKARVYARVGDTYNTQKQYGPALEAYKLSLKSLNSKQDLFNVYYNLGFIYFMKGQTQDSLKSFQSALGVVTNKDEFYKLLINMTQLYWMLNDRKNAAKCASKALSIARTKDSLYLNALMAFYNADYALAEKYVNEIIDNKATLEAIALLGRIYYQAGRYDELDALGMRARAMFTANPPFTYE